MAEFFKKLFKGILYVLVLPIILVVLALFAIVGLVQFCIVGIKGLFLFFSGRNIFGDFPEDIEAKKKLYGEPQDNPQVEVVDEANKPYITSPFDEATPDIDTVNNSQVPPLVDNNLEINSTIEPVSFNNEINETSFEPPEIDNVEQNTDDKEGQL